jgi:hypothetical protein
MHVFLMELLVWFGTALNVLMLVSVIALKRKDVSWLDFFLAGPMVLVKPSEFFKPGRASIPRTLFTLGMICMLIAWVLSWAAGNLKPN